MRCEDALLLISGHLDGENTLEEEKALQAHLIVCEDCRNTLRAFEEADLELSSLKEAAPEGLCADVMSQIKKETAKKKRRPWYGIAIAAALTLLIGVSAAVDVYEVSDEPQTVSVSDAYAVRREFPAADGETLAQKIAEERSAPVAVVHELYYEIETHPCETLEQGYLLYILPDHDAAIILGENYGCVIYEPSENAQSDVSYALLVP